MIGLRLLKRVFDLQEESSKNQRIGVVALSNGAPHLFRKDRVDELLASPPLSDRRLVVGFNNPLGRHPLKERVDGLGKYAGEVSSKLRSRSGS